MSKKLKISRSKFNQRKESWIESQQRIARRSFEGNGLHAGVADHSTPYLEEYLRLIQAELSSRSGKKSKYDKHSYWDKFEIVEN